MSDNLPATLDDLAKKIRDTLDRADKSQRHADDLRITAGEMLLAARQQVAAQKLVWADWLKVNVPDRSERDVRRLIAIAKAPDPEAAVEEDRRKAREGMKRGRTNVSPQPQIAPPRQPGTSAQPVITYVPPAAWPPDAPPGQKYSASPRMPRDVFHFFVHNGIEQVAEIMVAELTPDRAEQLIEALTRFLRLKRAAHDHVGPARSLH